MQKFDESLTVGTPSATEQQLQKPPSPLTIIVLSVILSSGALMIVGFLLRIARMDGNVNEAAQWGIGGMLVPWIMLGIGCLLLILREGVYLFETTAKRDITGDGKYGRSPVVALNPYQGRAALAADKHAADLTLWQTFVRGCETHTSWLSWQDQINRPTWQDWKDELLASGWAEKTNPGQQNSEWHLTAPAAEILAALATPQDDPSRTRA